MKQSYKVMGGVASLLLLSSLSGCGKKPEPIAIQNHFIPKNTLYVPYKGNKTFEKVITNHRPVQGFVLNNFQPVGFPTKAVDFVGMIYGEGILLDTHAYTRSDYDIYECAEKPLEIVITSVVTFFPLLYGGMCHHRNVFDYSSFDKNTKDFVKEMPLNREKIIQANDTLIQNITTLNQKASMKVSNAEQKLQFIQKKYDTLVQNSSLTIKQNIIDKSGFYNKENLSYKPTILKPIVPSPKSIMPVNFNVYKDAPFPCNSQSNCMTKINDTNTVLKQKAPEKMINLDKAFTLDIKQYEKQLAKSTEFVSLQFDNNLHTVAHHPTDENLKYSKKLNYKIEKAPLTLPLETKKTTVTYTIVNADFYNVYPSFSNEDNKIALHYDGKKEKLTIRNKTNKYIQLKSITMYYDGKINDNINNADSNFKSELSPKMLSVYPFFSFSDLGEYLKVSKQSLGNKKVSFGFAVKYSIGDTTKNMVLYKEEKYELYPLLKDLI